MPTYFFEYVNFIFFNKTISPLCCKNKKHFHRPSSGHLRLPIGLSVSLMGLVFENLFSYAVAVIGLLSTFFLETRHFCY